MKLPSGWKDVTISDYLKYYTLLNRQWGDVIDLEVNILSIFSGKSIGEIEKLKAKDIVAYSRQLEFLKTMPTEKVPVSFRCGKAIYKTTLLMEDMRADQFMNFSDCLKNTEQKDYVYQMPRLISCMVWKRIRRFPFPKYDYMGIKEADNIERHLSMEQAYPLFVFFCNYFSRLPDAIRDYLTKEITKMKKERLSEKRPLTANGVGL